MTNISPKAVIFDLDDTLISVYKNPLGAWTEITREYEDALNGHDVNAIGRAIHETIREFNLVPEQNTLWRLTPDTTRPMLVKQALAHFPELPNATQLATNIALRYESYRYENMQLFPESIPTLEKLRKMGITLAMLTNGSTRAQTQKIQAYDFKKYFDYIQIEETFGLGKPHPEAYEEVLNQLNLPAHDVWMLGDDLENDVIAPEKLGIRSYYLTTNETDTAVPTIASVADLPPLISGK